MVQLSNSGSCKQRQPASPGTWRCKVFMVVFPIKTKQDQLFFNTKGNLIERSLGSTERAWTKYLGLERGSS